MDDNLTQVEQTPSGVPGETEPAGADRPADADHAEALRAFFVAPEEHERLLTRLIAAHDTAGYGAVVATTLIELTSRRFTSMDRSGEITRWVANTRARLLREGNDEISPDPAAAEGLLRLASGLASGYADLDEELRGEIQYLLLALLREDLELDREALDAVLEAARSAAESIEQ